MSTWLGYALNNNGTGPTPPATQLILLSATTTSAAAAELLRIDTGLPLAPPSGKTWKVKIELASRRTVGATVGDSTGFEISYTIKNVGGVLSMVGASSMLFTGKDVSTGGIAFDQAELDLTGVNRVTGEAARTDLWGGTAYINEV